MNRRMKRGKDRKYDKDHQITLLLTDNSWIKEFTASKEITLESHSCLAFRKASAARRKAPTARSDQYVVLQLFIPQRAHLLFIIHLIIVRDFSPHVICSSALPSAGGKVCPKTVCQSKLKALKCALGGYDVCVASLTIIQHLCGMQLFFCVMTTMTRWLIY